MDNLIRWTVRILGLKFKLVQCTVNFNDLQKNINKEYNYQTQGIQSLSSIKKSSNQGIQISIFLWSYHLFSELKYSMELFKN